MQLTRKNHFNPCFWTAFWNIDYLETIRSFNPDKGKSRNALVWTLNLRSNKIFNVKTENVFFEKDGGNAEISIERLKKKIPDVYQEIEKDNEGDAYYKVDIENFLTEFENSLKPNLEKVVCTRHIESIEEKITISIFILFQIVRNHGFQSFGAKMHNIGKMESIIGLRLFFSDTKKLTQTIIPIIEAKWTLYCTKKHKFPLSDNPVLLRPHHIFFPLAPDMLLEINLAEKNVAGQICKAKQAIPFYKYWEYERKVIRNSSREIIFVERSYLEKIQKSRNFKRHIKVVEAFQKKMRVQSN